ncbi:MAG TPA: hypothetical protein VHX49_01825 [Candidatus Acidoferrales bacterium]|nr:hypothetical protein [Candidatus Acidoferrales bacterium]
MKSVTNVVLGVITHSTNPNPYPDFPLHFNLKIPIIRFPGAESGYHRFVMAKNIPIEELFPYLSQELQSLLVAQGEPDLAAQVHQLRIFDRCRCFDDYCATFYTKPKPRGGFGSGHRGVPLASAKGELILDVVDDVIAAVEVFHRDDIRREILVAVFP